MTGNQPRRGEVWLAEMDKLRPAVVMTATASPPWTNLTLLRKDRFVQRIGPLGPERMTDLCRALAIAVAGSGPGSTS